MQNQPPPRGTDVSHGERLNGHLTAPYRGNPAPPPSAVEVAPRSHEAFRWVSYAAVGCTYLLIVLGAFVRASGSGLGCPDWPLCYGQPLPPDHPPGMIEYSHRAFGGVTSLLIVGTVVLWIRAWGRRPLTIAGGAIIAALLALQVGLGAVVVKMELPPFIVMVHLGMAMLLLALLIGLAALASPPPRIRWPGAAIPDDRVLRLVQGAVAAVFVLVLTGALVRASGASWACAGFPTCNGELLPFGVNRLVDTHLLHRLFAYLVAAHLLVTAVKAIRAAGGIPAFTRSAMFMAACLVAQIAIGATAVSTGVPPATQVLHVAGAGALWASTVILLATTLRTRRSVALG